MSAGHSYYKLIQKRLDRFNKDVSKAQEAEKPKSEDISVDSTEDFEEIKGPNFDDSISDRSFNPYQLKHWHKFALQSYFSKIEHVKPITKKYYNQILLEFIKFSPQIDPTDISNFMEFKFKLNPSHTEFKIPYSKTQTKYVNVIKRFVQNIYTMDPLKIKWEYYKNQPKFITDIIPKLTYDDIFYVYAALIKNGKIEDALILNFIYTYAINPYVVYTLAYEGIGDNGFITYWDFKLSSNVVKPLHKELLNDINLFKFYRKPNFLTQKENERESPNHTIIKGTFIFNVSPTNIFNRFKRKFGVKSLKVRFTPGDVIKLSKHISRQHDNDYYPKINECNE